MENETSDDSQSNLYPPPPPCELLKLKKLEALLDKEFP